MKKLQHVLMLSTSFYPLPPGGAERQAERLSAYLVQRGIQVTVLTKHMPELKRYETHDGYEIIRIPGFGPGKVETFTFVLGAIWAMLFKIKRFDILHSHLVYAPGFAASIAGKLLGKKTIVRFRSSGPGSDLANSKRNLRGIFRMAVLKRLADCYIVLTQEMEDELILNGYDPKRIERMYNGVDANHFSPPAVKERNTELIPKDKTVLLFVGRLTPDKNVPLLLNALKRALSQCPNLYLILVGDGEEKEALIHLTDELNLQDYVKFVGSKPDVLEYLQMADIFVLSSLSEGISNSLLEAMSCGLACISTDVGAAKEILDDGRCGLIVPSDDVDGFTDAIVQLASDNSEIEKFGKLARLKIVNHYSIDAVGESYINLYQKLLADS